MNQTYTIRLPVHVSKELNVYLRVSRKLAQRLDHPPTPHEIAHELGKPAEGVLKLLRLSGRISSIDMIGTDVDKSLVATISDDTVCNPEIKFEGENLTSVLNSWLQNSPGKQREVLARRFGLLNHEE